MKHTLIIIATFLLAFGTSALLDADFIARHWVRTALVVLLIVVQLYAGFWLLREISTDKKEEP